MAVPGNTNPEPIVHRHSRIKAFFAGLASDLGEAAICVGLGIRSALAPALLLRSAVLGSLLGGFWLWLFWQHLSKVADLAMAGAATFVVGLLLPLGGITQYALIDLGMPKAVGTSGVFNTMVPDIFNAGIKLFNIGSIMLHILALSAVLIAVSWAVLYLLSTGLVSRALFWRRIRDRTLRSYPALQASSPPGPDVAPLAPRRGRRVALAVGLLVPFVSGVLLTGLICYGVVRLFFGSLVGDRLTPGQKSVVLRACVGPTVALGAMMIAMALVPVLNLLLPVLFGTAAGHMYYRAAGRIWRE